MNTQTLKYRDLKFESSVLKPLFIDIPYFKYSKPYLLSPKISNIFGDNLLFPTSKINRPYIISSFVTSIDGKIAYPDNKQGTLIAKNNFADPLEGQLDFWIMMALRACSDAVIVGPGTLRDDPDITLHVYDKELENDRVENGKFRYPYTVIVTRSGDINFDSKVIQQNLIPAVIATTKEGLSKVLEKSKLTTSKEVVILNNLKEEVVELLDNNSIYILIYEKEDDLFLNLKHKLGCNLISVEASLYSHYLIKNQYMDEIFLNYSGVYVGGESSSIGYGSSYIEGCSSVNHPHCRIVSMYMSSPYFIYTRQKFDYSV